jgi:hypothetical protein
MKNNLIITDKYLNKRKFIKAIKFYHEFDKQKMKIVSILKN